eukprot:GILK01009814.1.p1 GENE.GILK01009814.1~~GILK01009814.1.p1  ORF type:complete len:188 (-),score=19.50 GILK01009814.1:174-698(-)
MEEAEARKARLQALRERRNLEMATIQDAVKDEAAMFAPPASEPVEDTSPLPTYSSSMGNFVSLQSRIPSEPVLPVRHPSAGLNVHDRNDFGGMSSQWPAQHSQYKQNYRRPPPPSSPNDGPKPKYPRHNNSNSFQGKGSSYPSHQNEHSSFNPSAYYKPSMTQDPWAALERGRS